MRIIIARSQESYHEDEIEGDPEDADEVSHLPLVNLVLLLISFACLPMPGCCSWPAMLPLFLTMDQRSSGQGACVCFGGLKAIGCSRLRGGGGELDTIKT